jgi:D-alanyl-D-alanine carboxypeptidase/D-alanyl-D-alanine-endopeptidase (penicillin-binding protein 4)
LNLIKKKSFRNVWPSLAALASLTLLVALSVGANNFFGMPGKKLVSNDSLRFVDTSAHPMRVSFNGWSGDTAGSLNNLRAQLSDILDGREMRHTTVSVKIVFFDTNDAVHNIYSLHPGENVLPASTEKLFTSSSTLWALGSKYAFTTKLDLAPGVKIVGDKIVGNVYLRPSGDPTLRSADLDLVASGLQARGITKIQGDIISDLGGENPLSPEAKEYMAAHNASEIAVHDSVVGENGTIASVDSTAADDEENEDEAEAGALSTFPNFSLDRNIVTVTVIGGHSKGSPLAIRVNPSIGSIVVVNHGKSSAPASYRVRRVGRGKHRRTIRRLVRGTMTLRVSSSGEPMDARQTIVISGQFPARAQRTYGFPIKNVPLAMASVMKSRLQQNGIAVTGQPKVERVRSDTNAQTIAEKQTSLIDLLAYMNKHSDNYLAESMFRKLSTISQIAASAPDERARKLMRSWLEVCNVDGTDCTLIDGSGLSRSNQVSANSVINLLAGIKQRGMFELFTHTLSVAGYDGTLRNRMKGTAAQFNAHGKTGTLNGVTALAGYVTTGDGQLAAYFITMQHFRGGPWTYKRDQDKIVEALASFKYADYQGRAITPPVGVKSKADDEN